MQHRSEIASRLSRSALAAVLAVGLLPTTAWGEPGESTDESAIESFAEDFTEQLGIDWEKTLETGSLVFKSDPYDFEEGTATTLSANLPSSYDLRNKGVVTPVKFQNPWGSCWGFAAIAAAETSILSELGTTYEATGLDLSELQLAWFAATPLDESAGSQAGEGTIVLSDDPNQRLNAGGKPFTATSVLASGIGPVPESVAPYKNAEGYTMDLNGVPVCYSTEGDWSVDESLRFASAIELEESSILPSPAGKDENGNYEYNAAGTAAIKNEIANGRAVAISFAADQYLPGKAGSAKYINTDTWAHYTYEQQGVTHGVTIVGWDDDYSKENFLEGHQPPEDGAWIVKNSWGSASEKFPNHYNWGNDGYFYLSYYDQSLLSPESLDFYTENFGNGQESYYVDAYDYMPSNGLSSLGPDLSSKASNVFTAEGDRELRAVSSETVTPGTTVSYSVYRLSDNAQNPEDGTLIAQAKETYEFGGYHRTDLAKPVFIKDGERFSIVVEQVTPSGAHETTVSIGTSKAGALAQQQTGEETVSYSNAVVNKGESLYCSNGKWNDWADVVSALSAKPDNIVVFDNFPIKAYSDPVESTSGFEDVSPDDWFAGAVDHVSEIGAMNGYAGTSLFGPDDNMTRQDVASMLFRWLAPEEAAAVSDPEIWQTIKSTSGLSDVADGQYYTAAVNWCYKNGLMAGYGDANELGVDDPITREQFAAILYRAAKATEDGPVGGNFPDADQVSDWAAPAMAWAINEGVVNGADGMLLPQRSATRAEVAAMVLNFDSRSQA